MTLLNPMIDFKKYSPFEDGGARYFWGRVLSNRDPKLLGRIKVQIHDLLPFEKASELPWIYPKLPIGVGQGPLSGSQYIPEESSYIIVEFPFNTIYFGFYTGTFNDRLRRQPDLLSEYPERYGWVDSRENKFIVNKAPRVDSIEHRYADGTLAIHDSKESINYYTDRYGTKVVIDRANQHLCVEFGDVKINIRDGRINIQAKEMHLQIWRLFRLVCQQAIHLFGKTSFTLGGKLLAIMTKRIHTPDEGEAEYLPKHTKRASQEMGNFADSPAPG